MYKLIINILYGFIFINNILILDYLVLLIY